MYVILTQIVLKKLVKKVFLDIYFGDNFTHFDFRFTILTLFVLPSIYLKSNLHILDEQIHDLQCLKRIGLNCFKT